MSEQLGGEVVGILAVHVHMADVAGHGREDASSHRPVHRVRPIPRPMWNSRLAMSTLALLTVTLWKPSW